MTNHPNRRRVHLFGETMTACGKIINGTMRGHKLVDWSVVMPSWRCPACVKEVKALRATITDARTM